MFLEGAIDQMGRERTGEFLAAEIHEFRMLGTARQDQMLLSLIVRLGHLGQGVSSMEAGYLLGLETMRFMLYTNQAAMAAKIEL